jgi:outer membrane protein assembly factor BamA
MLTLSISKKFLFRFFFLITIILSGYNSQSQVVANPFATPDSVTQSKQMDVVDVLKLVFKNKKKPNKPRKQNDNGPFITASPYPSYSLATGFAGVAPVNVSFYTNKKEKGNLSFFNNMFQYTQYKQTIAFSLSNLFLGHDKWELIGDWRYYHFPTYTYGLGSQTSLKNVDQIDYSHLRVYETVMHKVDKNVDLGIGYHLDYHWGIRDFAAQEGTVTDFVRYGLRKNSISSGLSLNFLYDSRNNVNKPVKGFYFNFQFRTNLKVLGSSNNWNSMTIDVRKYVPLPIHWDAGFAFWGYLWLTVSGKPPYLDLPSTGWDTYNNTGRGYAMGRFRGRNMVYLESEFRFALMKNGLLGGVVFGNLQTFSEWPKGNFSTIQPAVGAGLRIKLNKRTNTNSAVDYGFGSGGSRGFAFNLNEVF